MTCFLAVKTDCETSSKDDPVTAMLRNTDGSVTLLGCFAFRFDQ